MAASGFALVVDKAGKKVAYNLSPGKWGSEPDHQLVQFHNDKSDLKRMEVNMQRSNPGAGDSYAHQRGCC